MKAENKQGWAGRGKGVEAPHKDRSITVEPIRMIKDINKIKEYLKDKPRDFALFVLGINSGLRGSDLLKLKFKLTWANLVDCVPSGSILLSQLNSVLWF